MPRALAIPARGRGSGPLHQAAPDPLSQLRGGTLREREGEDLVGPMPVADHAVAIAIDQDAGLSGSGAGLREDVAIAALDRSALRIGRLDLQVVERRLLGDHERELLRPAHDPLPPLPPSSGPIARSRRQIGW